jgi:hypothetical protein
MSLATSTTKSKAAPARVFATLRLAGDRLEPARISAILGVQPTKSWRRGEHYVAGSRAGTLVGRTGTWFLTTEGHVDGPLEAHLDYLANLLIRDSQRLAMLQALMATDQLQANISCFWHGYASEHPPTLPRKLRQLFRSLPATIETDFDADYGA